MCSKNGSVPSPDSGCSEYSTPPTPACVPESKERTRTAGRRIPHRKSRAGCKTCKSRKVKCDEVQPSCSRCERLHICCEYTHLQKPPSPPPPPPCEERCKIQDPSPKFEPNTPCAPVAGSPGLDLMQLELLHTYINFTSLTFPWSSALRDFWKITVPSLALQHEYLTRAVLCIPALHLAHLRPERRGFYVSLALENHRLASESVRLLLENVSEKNGLPLFLFSALNIIIVLATPQRSSQGVIADGDASFQDLLVTLQGMKGLLEILWDTLSTSALAPLLSHGSGRLITQQHSFHPAETDFPPTCSSLDEFQARINTQGMDPDTLMAYNRAIEALWGVMDWRRQHWEEADALIWVYRCLVDFIPLLSLQKQEALVLLAHFAVVLKTCETRWWMQGWAIRIISNAYQQLDDEHKIWVYRPATDIGWIIPMQ
ncbi:C6 zinc finger protein [Colletotrichum tabaci]|uniref:C6 zinc finger protein n=1 Tax=Colletotrichum tabaci TaxID=1209068 RepID=A0AAV9TKP9_9PEZI